MTKSCWRKKKTPFSNVLHHYVNKFGGVVDIAQETDGMYKGTYTVFSNRKKDFGGFSDKSFKTSKEAYNFAKKFMKENCE